MSNGKQSTGGQAGSRTISILLAVAMVVGLGFSLYIFSTVAEREAQDSASLLQVRDIRLDAPALAENADEATRGDLDSFPAVRNLAVQIDASMAKLGGPTGLVIAQPRLGEAAPADEEPVQDAEVAEGEQGPAPVEITHVIGYEDPAVREHIISARLTWVELLAQVNRIIGNQRSLTTIYGLAGEIENDYVPALREALQTLVDQLVEKGARPDQVATVGKMILFNAQVGRDLNRVLRAPHLSEEEQEQAASQLFINVANLGQTLDALLEGDEDLGVRALKGDESRELLEAAADTYLEMGELMFELEERTPEVYDSRNAAAELGQLASELRSNTEQIDAAIGGLQSRRLLSTDLGYVMAVIGLLAMLLLGFVNLRETRQRHDETVRQKAEADALNQRNQEAILQLLDELSYLAEGDLSKEATVNEEITGAIADSVNYAIDALRTLVSSINETSVEVTDAAQQTRLTTLQLAEASAQQAGQIADASSRINDMAQSMVKVSEEAGNSAEVAKRSVDIAHEGGEVVRNSITGMDTIREQIQETSKRIKRLGESSQEIGAIVELINDIADQTNILALNAAIQAAMAGEAGRGFAVVADEVQRLAERSTDATKQIGALINTIQADTNEAVTSMERSTANVVTGAQLASDAGSALEQIESVSNQLFVLIQGIAETASQEAGTAADLSTGMNSIREVTTQTTAGTNETANEIGRLAELAEQLRDSVAGFKLPEAKA